MAEKIYIDRESLFTKVLEEKKFVFRTDDLLNDEVILRTVYDDFGKFLYSLPIVDAVEVVRCRECELCEKLYPERKIKEPERVEYFCKAEECHKDPNDFCSYGKRKGFAEE